MKKENYLFLGLISLKIISFEFAEIGICLMRDASNKSIKACCADFENKEGECTPCSTGYTSYIGKMCQPCPDNSFGNVCTETCVCNKSQRCDHIFGCVDNSTQGSLTTSTKMVQNGNLSTAGSPSHGIRAITTNAEHESSFKGVNATNIVVYYIVAMTVLIAILYLSFAIFKYKRGRKCHQTQIRISRQEPTNQIFEINEQSVNVYEDIDDTEIDDTHEVPEPVQ